MSVEVIQEFLAVSTHALTHNTLAIIVTITTIFLFFLAIYIASSSRNRDKTEALRFRYMLETSPIAVRIATKDGSKVVFANKRYCELINIDSIVVVGKDPVSYYTHPSEYEDIIRKINTGSQILDQLVELTISGQGRKLVLATYMMISYEGEPAVLGWFYDITKGKQDEMDLQKNRAELSALICAVPDLIWMKDLEGTFLSCNPAFERLLGVKEANIIGKTDYDFFDESMANFFRENDRNVILTNNIKVNEEWFTFADNGYCGLFEATKTPVRHQDGTILGILGVAHDITEQRKIENSLRIAAAAFESQEGIIVTDSNNFILRVNHAFTRITGYSIDDAIGQTPRLFKSTNHDADFYIAMWQQIANTGAYEGEVWNCRKNGEVYPVQLNITAVKDDAGYVTNYVGALTDITSRKAAEARAGFLAYHDRLTELPNRELFYDRLSQAISQARRKSEGIALLFLDLDGFKPVNDAFGHEAGDVALKIVAKRLQACVRSMDTVARMGGDEFAIILSALQNPLDAQVIAQKIISNIAEVIQLNATTTCVIGVSIGIAIYPDNGTEIDVLMNAADSAMYDSKAAGKNTYTYSTIQNQERSNVAWINLDEVSRVGVAIIDEQHLNIVSMLNAINNTIKYKEPIGRLSQLLDELISFTDYHFKTEERLMSEYGYLDEIKHKNTHELLLHEVAYLKTQFMQGGELVFLQKLKDWFTIHISNSDKPLADFILQQNAK
jgi:diguanylate cyclase (GGDEF)-like protein/hemerythrin-like metal-binding protein/PAS domain S-box-containing protein